MLSHADVIAAMQAAILAGAWGLADQIAHDNFVNYTGETDPCRWCGVDAQANYVWWRPRPPPYGFDDDIISIPFCSRCEEAIALPDKSIMHTDPFGRRFKNK